MIHVVVDEVVATGERRAAFLKKIEGRFSNW